MAMIFRQQWEDTDGIPGDNSQYVREAHLRGDLYGWGTGRMVKLSEMPTHALCCPQKNAQ